MTIEIIIKAKPVRHWHGDVAGLNGSLELLRDGSCRSMAIEMII
jgi:hypothetical protein